MSGFVTYVIYGPYPDSKKSKIVFFGVLVILLGWFGVEAYMHGGVCALLDKITSPGLFRIF